ncbi:MAG: hypothetical protein ACC631_02200 [Halocynthiibacter sp.]
MQRIVSTILIAGVTAIFAFDLFGQGLSPLFGYARLAPVELAKSTLNAVFGSTPGGSAFLLHAFTGTIAYPLGYFLLARPIQRTVIPNLHWAVTAIVYGVVLWFFAVYIMASLVAGLPAFLGWTGITWVALWGHIVFALVAAWVIEARGLRFDLINR